jgi:glycosyltransferase involved in cell wall biosynthesis
VKVLQLISSSGFFGAESVLYELSKGISQLGVDNVIGIFRNSYKPHLELVERANRNNLKYEIFPCRGKLDIFTLIQLIKFSRKYHVDLFHSHGYKADLYAYIASRALGKPVIATCHNWNTSDVRSKIYYALDKMILRGFDRVVSVSHSVREELIRHGVNDRKALVIPNGVAIDKYRRRTSGLRKEFNIKESSRVVGSVARLTSEKGLCFLLNAAKAIQDEYKDTVFMIVGDGPLYEDLRNMAKDLGISDSVILTGQRDDMANVYSTFDMVVVSSLTEGFPMTVLEAMAAGKAVIATAVGEIPRIIEHKRTGIVVEKADVTELKEAIESLLRDSNLRRQVAEAGFQEVSTKYTADKMCEEYQKVYGMATRRDTSR